MVSKGLSNFLWKGLICMLFCPNLEYAYFIFNNFSYNCSLLYFVIDRFDIFRLNELFSFSITLAQQHGTLLLFIHWSKGINQCHNIPNRKFDYNSFVKDCFLAQKRNSVKVHIYPKLLIANYSMINRFIRHFSPLGVINVIRT